MCTYFGCCGKINTNDINDSAIKESDLIFLEGYLWDEGDAKSAFDKALKTIKKFCDVFIR